MRNPQALQTSAEEAGYNEKKKRYFKALSWFFGHLTLAHSSE